MSISENKINDGFDDARDTLGKDTVDNFLANFGMGPKYVPTEPQKYKCSKCGLMNAVYKEIHPDTSMNDIVLWCPDCGYLDE